MNTKIIAIIIFVIIGGLSYSFFTSEPKTIAYYLENKEAREAKIKECEALGFDMLSNTECVNATDASAKARMDTVLDGYKPSTHKGVPLNSY